MEPVFSEFDGFPNIHDYRSTGESFFTPITQSMSGPDADGILDEPDILLDNLSPGMNFSAERDGTSLPYTSVLGCERKAILETIESCSGGNQLTQSVNQRTRCNFEPAAATWNALCMAELEKPFFQRRAMFLKTASLMQSFHAKYLRECNAAATIRQQLLVDREGGLQESVIASREIA